MFAKAGIEICALMGYSTFVNPDPARIEANTAAAMGLLDLARDLGCPIQRVFIGTPEGDFKVEDAVQSSIENLKRVTGHAEKTGVKLAIETHDKWLRGEVLRSIVDGVDSPYAGICWDVANSHYFGHQQAETFEVIHDHINHVHFKDIRVEKASSAPQEVAEDELQASAHPVDDTLKIQLPGEGEVDLLSALARLEGMGYNGYYSFEWEKKWVPELAEPEIALPIYVEHCAQLQEQLKASTPAPA